MFYPTTTPVPLTPVSSGGFESYKVLRGYAQHEDDLVNHRVAWLLVVNGFLLAGLGFTIREVPAHPHWILYDFMYLCAVAGMAISFLSRSSIFAAVGASGTLHKSWEQSLRRSDYPVAPSSQSTDDVRHVAPLTGGGNEAAAHKGHRTALWLPVFLVLFWFGVILYVHFRVVPEHEALASSDTSVAHAVATETETGAEAKPDRYSELLAKLDEIMLMVMPGESDDPQLLGECGRIFCEGG